MFPQGGVHIAEDDTLFLEILAVAVIHHLGLILCGHAGQILPFGLRDAQFFVGVLDRLRDIVPVVAQRLRRLDVVVDVIEVDARHVAAPPWHGPITEPLERLEAEVPHPVGFTLHPGHLPDDVLIYALGGLVDVVLLVTPAELVSAEVET